MKATTLVSVSLVCGVVFGCSSGSNDDGPLNGSGGGIVVGAGQGNVAGNLGSGGRSGGSGGSGTSASCLPTPDDEGCVGEQYEGESLPLDVYVLFDQSCSMSCPISRGGPGQCCMGDPNGRILPVRDAMDAFLHDPESAGIGFGLGYFGFQPIGQTSCAARDYASPSVPVTLDHDAVLRSLAEREPIGETPTGAAIRGACSYAQEWKQQNAGQACGW